MNQLVILENRLGSLAPNRPEAIAWESLSVNTRRAYQHVYDKEDISSVLYIRRSKTDQNGAGMTLYVGSSTRRAIHRYCVEGSIIEGALFRRVRYQQHVCPGRLSIDGARNAIKRRAREAGIQGFISGHSLRVGSAMSLAQVGASVVEMQIAGRWKSPQMPAHYARAELVDRGAIARFKYGK